MLGRHELRLGSGYFFLGYETSTNSSLPIRADIPIGTPRVLAPQGSADLGQPWRAHRRAGGYVPSRFTWQMQVAHPRGCGPHAGFAEREWKQLWPDGRQ